MNQEEVFYSDGKNICCEANYLEFYIPKYYFNSNKKIAIDNIDTITVMGVFPIGLFKNNKFVEMRTLNVPINIVINQYEYEDRDVELPTGKEPCRVVIYHKDQIVMVENIVEDSDNALTYLDRVTGGSLPPSIRYCDTRTIWAKNLQLTKVSFGVPSTILEMVLAVVYRDPNDLSKKFAQRYGKGELGEYDYVQLNIRKICEYSSTYTAITYEDMDQMLTSAINRGDKKGADSPLEEIISF